MRSALQMSPRCLLSLTLQNASQMLPQMLAKCLSDVSALVALVCRVVVLSDSWFYLCLSASKTRSDGVAMVFFLLFLNTLGRLQYRGNY